MERHFVRELGRLKRDLLSAGKMALAELGKAIEALVRRDELLAREVLQADQELDEREMRVEEECLKLLALYQPVAHDLRYVTSVIKINSLVERVGDMAAKIARRALYLVRRPPLNVETDFRGLGELVLHMQDLALEAFVDLDLQKAQQVLEMDSQVDNEYRNITRRLLQFMAQHPDMIEEAFQTLNLARHFERAGDRATDIAQQVFYIETGKIARHTHHDEDDDSRGPEEKAS